MVVPLLQTLGHGLGAYDTDIDKHVLDATCHLASTHYDCLRAAVGGVNTHATTAAVQALLVPLHEKVFTAYILDPFDLSLELIAARALYSLTCCNVAKTNALVDDVLARQPRGGAGWERLAQAFTTFMSDGGLQFDMSREHTVCSWTACMHCELQPYCDLAFTARYAAFVPWEGFPSLRVVLRSSMVGVVYTDLSSLISLTSAILLRPQQTQFVSNFRQLLNNIRGFVLVF